MDLKKSDWRRGVFVLIVIAVVAAYIIIRQISQTSVQEARDNLVQTTTYTSAAADGYAVLVKENIGALGNNSDLTKLATDRSPTQLKQATEVLSQVKNNLNTVERIGVYDTSGKLLVENIGTSRTMGSQLATNSFFKQTIDSKGVVVSPVLVSPVTDRNTIAIAVPMETNGKVWAVVVGLINFDDLKDFFSGVQGNGSYTTLLDQQGNLLFDTRSKKADTAENQTFLKANVPSAIYSTKEPDTGEAVTRSYKKGSLFTVSVSKYDKDLHRVTRRVTTIVVIGAIVINLILDVLFAARIIVFDNRIDQLSYVIDSLNKEGQVVGVDPEELKHKDKLGDLANRIDTLAQNEKQKRS